MKRLIYVLLTILGMTISYSTGYKNGHDSVIVNLENCKKTVDTCWDEQATLRAVLIIQKLQITRTKLSCGENK